MSAARELAFPPKKFRVAIVEDNADDRAYLVALVRGERSLAVAGVFASRSAVETSLPATRPDLVLLDLRVPGVRHKFDLLHALRTLAPQAGIIVVTVDNAAATMRQAFEAGARGFVEKPFAALDLMHALQVVAAGGCYASPGILGEFASLCKNLGQLRRSWGLTPKESRVLELLASGVNRADVCARLSIGDAGLRSHLLHIYQKMHVHSESSAVATYLGGPLFGI